MDINKSNVHENNNVRTSSSKNKVYWLYNYLQLRN